LQDFQPWLFFQLQSFHWSLSRLPAAPSSSGLQFNVAAKVLSGLPEAILSRFSTKLADVAVSEGLERDAFPFRAESHGG